MILPLECDGAPQTFLAGHSPTEKRKVGSSTLPLTIGPEEMYAGPDQLKHEPYARLRAMLLARSYPPVTAGRRTLGHVECTEFACGSTPRLE